MIVWEWMIVPSMGRSGGILKMWDGGKGNFVSLFQGKGFVGVRLEWGVSKNWCIILKAYGPCDFFVKNEDVGWYLSGERQLCREILALFERF